jgi:hypothetical protein
MENISTTLQKNATEEKYKAVQPDGRGWVYTLAFNDALVKNDPRHPGFGDYLVENMSGRRRPICIVSGESI